MVEESNIKALVRAVRIALRSVFLGLILGGSHAAQAEPFRLSWLVGTSSQSTTQSSKLWNRVEAEQWFSRERFFLSADILSLSLLSGSRNWGYGVGAGVGIPLGASFEWLPSVRLEKDAGFSGVDPVFQSMARYQLWSLLLETQVAVAFLERDEARLFRLRQSLGMSLGEGASREDFIFFDLEFVDRMRSQVKRVGLVFASRVEF